MSSCLTTRRFFSTTHRELFFQKFFQPVIDASKPKPHVTSQLFKPVGLPIPPTKDIKYSKGNSFKDLFDQEKTKKRTEELTLEMSKSGMYDMFTFRKTNGKLFLAPKSYWRKDKALYFPHMVGTPLAKSAKMGSIEDNLRGKISIVRIFGSKTGNDLSAEFTKYIEDNLKDKYQNVQLVNINWMENRAKTFIIRMSMWSMRSKISKDLQKNYFVCDREQLPFTVREKLMINNLYTGYTLLVDSDVKIRWMASGGATEEEAKIFVKSIKGIQQEVAKPTDRTANP